MTVDHLIFRGVGFPNHNGRQQPLDQDAENQLIHFVIILHPEGMILKGVQFVDG